MAAIRSLGRPGAAKCVIVEGGNGSGKSLAAAAFQAECHARGADAVFVNEGSLSESLVERARAGDALIIDNLDQLSLGLRKALFAGRHRASCGTLITASRLTAVERNQVGSDDDCHLLGRWEERPFDVLMVATLIWRDLGLRPDLPEVCGDGVAQAISSWTWLSGAHSIRHFVRLLAEALDIEGYFARTPRIIGVEDVYPALAAVIREERPPERENAIRIVVEGRTDAMYLEAAARLAYGVWGADLLADLHVAPPGEDREGGAEKAAAELIALERQGAIAVGLFDYDEAGREALKDVRKYAKLSKVHGLPPEFDPLSSPKAGNVEIEDLVSPALIERFYEANPDLQPEERTTRGKRARVVIAGPDKDRAAAWICEHASFEEMAKIVYVLCVLRQSVELRLPSTCPRLTDWLRELRAR